MIRRAILPIQGGPQIACLVPIQMGTFGMQPWAGQNSGKPKFKRNLSLGGLFLGAHTRIALPAIWMAGEAIWLCSYPCNHLLPSSGWPWPVLAWSGSWSVRILLSLLPGLHQGGPPPRWSFLVHLTTAFLDFLGSNLDHTLSQVKVVRCH